MLLTGFTQRLYVQQRISVKEGGNDEANNNNQVNDIEANSL